MIVKLSKLRSLFPFSFFITGITGRERYPSFSGGFGDIYRASYQSRPVAVKQLRYFENVVFNMPEFFRETLVWKDLVHPYILPFLGIDLDNFPDHLCLVSPWMENGTVLSYLENHGHSNVDKLLYEVAQGVLYLHSRNYVHGDLRGANILINPDQSACLADFGLSVISEVTLTGSSSRAGSIYWMAPELIDPDRLGGKFTRTPQSDVYAFGCVCVELYTGRPPFKDLSEPAALFQIVSGARPERPHGMSDKLWECVNRYWVDDPAARPAIEAVVQNMIWPAREPA
ncbi:kinase-like domain-containing protein [Mycena metata]|uniref:Kinase-like domain-containing protein n=1 Tax=Mycena metata TaxID=1033252 RepID=A0AAD7K4R8_9AGAR|nr:kinase-like domain-containing protein [Mycena metata]